MTQEQKRIAIAEACGWKVIPLESKLRFQYWEKDGRSANRFELPDYFNDLNADQQDDIIARTEHEFR